MAKLKLFFILKRGFMKKIILLILTSFLSGYFLLAGCGGATSSGSSAGSGGSGGLEGTGGGSGGNAGTGGTGGGLTGTGAFTTVTSITDGSVARSVEFYIPTTISSNPPLVLVFHGTGTTDVRSFVTEDGDNINIDDVAISNGFIVAAPQALEHTGGNGDPDHRNENRIIWNLDTDNITTNNDLVLVQNIITYAQTAYHINTNRIYSIGFSNGGFFSYLVAMRLNTTIAAFAENAAGAITCANPGGSETAREQCTFMASGFTGTTCSQLSSQTGYSTCTSTCNQALRPTPLPTSGRIPPGYISHDPSDNSVSSFYSCQLFNALNSGRRSLSFHSSGHSVPDGFSQAAWSYMSGFTLSN